MIIIEDLRVVYDAEQQRDEAVFARLFNLHMDEWERRQERERVADATAGRDRSLRGGKSARTA